MEASSPESITPKPTDEDVAIAASDSLLAFLRFKVRNQDDAGKMLATHYLEQKCWKWFETLHRRNQKGIEYQSGSRLIAHALHEFSLLPKEENARDEELHEWLKAGVLDLLFVLSQQGHSGGTIYEMLRLFDRLARFGTLSPITDNPAEWKDMSAVSGYPFWQNKRNSSLFSKDGGKTYFSVDAAEKTELFTSEPYADAVQTKEG